MRFLHFYFLLCLIATTVLTKPSLKQKAKKVVGLDWEKVPEKDREGHIQDQRNALNDRKGKLLAAKSDAEVLMVYNDAKNALPHQINAFQRQKSVVRITKNLEVLNKGIPIKMKTKEGNKQFFKTKP